MIIGRKDELEELDNRYKANVFQFGIVYGSQRIGKTTPRQSEQGRRRKILIRDPAGGFQYRRGFEGKRLKRSLFYRISFLESRAAMDHF